MSDNKKYYYIKLKDNYFDQDNIKVLESMPNGHTYSLIIIKLYLKSCKYEGRLMMTERIPYDPDKMDILSNVIGHDIAHVREAIKLGKELGLISVFDTGDIWMTEMQNFIGHSSTEADRKRLYRAQMDGQMSVICPDKSPPEKELEKERDIELKKDKKKADKPRDKAPDYSDINNLCLFLSENNITYNVGRTNMLAEWLQYKKEIKSTYKPTGLLKLIKSLEPFTDDEVKTAVDSSIMNGYKGIFPKSAKSPSQATYKRQRGDNYDLGSAEPMGWDELPESPLGEDSNV